MISPSLPLFILLASRLTLSIPLAPTVVLLPLQNETIPIPSPPTTRLGAWPDAPFSRHLAWDTDIDVLRRAPSPASDPTSEMAVLEGISLIGSKARSQSRLSSIQDFREESGPVTFVFHATEDLFSGPNVAKVLDALWEMTNSYGKGEVYGCLVRVEVTTAYFELGLKK